MKEKIVELKSRWETSEGNAKLTIFIKSIQKGQSLDKINFAEKHNDKWDLRGINLSQPNKTKKVRFDKYELSRAESFNSFSKINLENIDFSFANLNNSFWEKCIFNNCVFERTHLRYSGIWASSFNDVSFLYSDLRDTCLGGNIGLKTTVFTKVDFSHSNLQDTTHGFAEYNNCCFNQANLKNVDFDGARFNNCKFSGLLDSVAFRAHSRIPSVPLLPFKKTKTDVYVNQMYNVDFIEAELRGVDFDGVNLNHCFFANDPTLLVVKNQYEIFNKAKQIIVSDWQGEHKRIALYLLDNLYLTENKKNQPIQVINKMDDTEILGKDFSEKFFSLLEDLIC